MEARIELADAIEAVRQQLLDATARGAGQEIRFEVGTVQLDFDVELKRDARAKGGIRTWVLSAEAEAGAAHRLSHRVSVTLTPRNARTGAGVEVGNPELGSREGF
ncbi:trypco2 family protein [Kitasatospora sp. NPDC056138]|uniref:trypco2 family protein n=1 Tax=Kitasatospora sp. NPDC056138 TaxID=3345724 RepID=UPI0035D9B76F